MADRRGREEKAPESSSAPGPERNLGQILDLLAPDLSSVLVGEESWRRMRRISVELSADWVSFLGFEARLGPFSDGRRGDLAFNLTPEGLRRLSEGPFPRRWRRLARLCEQWGARSSVPFANAGEMWVELDMDDRGPWPAPNVFLSPGRESASPEPSAQAATVETCRWIGGTAAELFMARPPSRAVRQRLQRYVEQALRASLGQRQLRKVQVGMMSGRPVDGLRLCLLGLPAERVEGLLTEIRWPGARDLVSRRLQRFAPLVDDFGLHLDVGPELYPTLGLELLFDRSPWDHQPAVEPRWEKLLNALAADGLVRTDQVDGLLTWPGTTVDPAWLVQRALGDWAGLEESMTTVEHGVWTRGLAYLKWTLSPAGEEGMKAYFGAFSEQNHSPELRRIGAGSGRNEVAPEGS